MLYHRTKGFDRIPVIVRATSQSQVLHSVFTTGCERSDVIKLNEVFRFTALASPRINKRAFSKVSRPHFVSDLSRNVPLRRRSGIFYSLSRGEFR